MLATVNSEMTEPHLKRGARDNSHVPRGTVAASLKFYDAPIDGSKPFNYPLGTEPPEGTPRRNFGDIDISVEINDVRDREAKYNIDENGFTMLKAGHSATVNFHSDQSIREEYYSEIRETLLQRFPEAKLVVPFDHTVRPSDGSRPPVLRTHIDQSKAAAIGRVHAVVPGQADELLKGRFRIINVWRPLNGPVQSFPLAFADSVTVKDEDLHIVEHRYAD